MNKRQWLMGGVAAAAGLAGAGLAWWKFQPHEVTSGALEGLWDREWEGLKGQTVAMQGFRGRPLVLNFWATWCPPCVKELPLLNAFYRQHREQGWQVLGLAVDGSDAVSRFLEKLPLDFPVALAGVGGVDLSRQLGNAAGGLPYTVLFDASGAVRQRKVGQLSPEDLARWSAVE